MRSGSVVRTKLQHPPHARENCHQLSPRPSQGKRIWNFLDIRAAEKARGCLNLASDSVICSHIALKSVNFRDEKLADAA
jgi:hypothetical protein